MDWLIVGTAWQMRGQPALNRPQPCMAQPSQTPPPSLSDEVRLCWHQELVPLSLEEPTGAFVTYAPEKGLSRGGTAVPTRLSMG